MTHVQNRWIGRIVTLVIALACAPALAAGPTTKGAAKPKPSFAQYVHEQVESILDDAQGGGDFNADGLKMLALFDQAVLFGPDDQPAGLREADESLRMMRQLIKYPAADRPDMIKFLRSSPKLAAAMAFLLDQSDSQANAYELLDKLRKKHPEQMEKYANLVAAVCAVHRQPLTRRINENTVHAGDPMEIFEYYVANESRMYFGIQDVPAELLVYVVDSTASPGEMNWALAKYAGDRDIGKHFFDVKYDYANFHTGAAKKVTKDGYTLQNILKDGGVCADQAYFATEIGKAIGVPTAMAVGSSAEVGHAWVGFLQSSGHEGAWNFDEGRYEAYRGVRGVVFDPQLRVGIPDSFVSLLAELIGTKAEQRQTAIALTDAASRLMELQGLAPPIVAARKNPWTAATRPSELPPANPPAALPDIKPPQGLQDRAARGVARSLDTDSELHLLEAALHQSPGYAPAWLAVRDLALINKLSYADKRRWSDLLARMGSKKYPDFTFEILAPMVATVSDVHDQDALWNGLFDMVKDRFDLAAAVRIHEAEMWNAHNEKDKAGQCCIDVIQRYANAGPFIIPALLGAEQLLKDTKRGDKVLVLYHDTWKSIKAPREMAGQFVHQSNWYRVGMLYASKLKEAGQGGEAAKVEESLSRGEGAVGAR